MSMCVNLRAAEKRCISPPLSVRESELRSGLCSDGSFLISIGHFIAFIHFYQSELITLAGFLALGCCVAVGISFQ